MTEDVVSWGQTNGNLDGMGEAVSQKLFGGPTAWIGSGDETRLGNLGELEGLLVNGGEITGRGGDVVDNGAVVGIGPCVPYKGHGAASSNSGGASNGGSAFVTDNVGGVHIGREDEAIVLIGSLPANGIGRGARRDTAGVLGAISDDSGDVSVGVDGCDQGKD